MAQDVALAWPRTPRRVRQGSTRFIDTGRPQLRPGLRRPQRTVQVAATDGGNNWRRRPDDARWGTSVPPARRRGLINFGLGNWDRLWGETSYQYYNWRQDTTNDLVLFVAFFAFLILSGTLIKPLLLEEVSADGPDGFWMDLYEILALSLSQDLPPASPTQFTAQVFSVGVAALGLAAFALVLALVEQVVFEVFDENVRRGGEVYEDGHVLVLAWCAGQRDFEVLTKVLFQLCQAYRCDGGTVVVVLSQRPKLEMEATLRRSLPPADRHGTRFVFRSGSPLVPDDLRAVSAHTAATTVIIADQSRPPDEADAQSIRCAILLDELEPPTPPADAAVPTSAGGGGGGGSTWSDNLGLAGGALQAIGLGLRGASGTGGTGKSAGASSSGAAAPRPRSPIVVELLTGNAMAMLYYSCSSRVLAVPTAQLNARRIAKLLQNPVVSTISQQIMSFETPASCLYVQSFPELTGLEFSEVPFRFDSAIVLGTVNRITRKASFSVSPKHKLSADEDVVLLRPTDVSFPGFRPLPQVVPGTPSMEEAQAWAAAANQQACNLGPHTAGGAAPAGAAAGAAGAGDLSGAAFGIEAGAVTARRLAPKAGGRGRARHAAPALSPATLQVLMGALPVPSAGKQQAATDVATAAAATRHPAGSGGSRGPTVSRATQLDSASEDDIDRDMWRAFASDDFTTIRINDDGTVDLDSVTGGGGGGGGATWDDPVVLRSHLLDTYRNNQDLLSRIYNVAQRLAASPRLYERLAEMSAALGQVFAEIGRNQFKIGGTNTSSTARSPSSSSSSSSTTTTTAGHRRLLLQSSSSASGSGSSDSSAAAAAAAAAALQPVPMSIQLVRTFVLPENGEEDAHNIHGRLPYINRWSPML